MSKNIIEAVVELNNNRLGLISSRRQIDYNNGYVMTTKELMKYKGVTIQRDHAGPLQGTRPDNGCQSICKDIKEGIRLIHIDPWKVCNSIESAAHQTSDLIKYCYRLNPKCCYEIGTEEQIYKYSFKGFEKFITMVVKSLSKKEFLCVKFAVVQSGTIVRETKNTGTFNEKRSKQMTDLCHSLGLLAKEHNSDYLLPKDITNRVDCGVDAFNVAPEFGVLETKTIINELRKHGLIWEYGSFLEMCVSSKKWVKWVDNKLNRERLSQICGHYMFSNPEFLPIKDRLNKECDIDTIIKSAIQKHLTGLLNG